MRRSCRGRCRWPPARHTVNLFRRAVHSNLCSAGAWFAKSFPSLNPENMSITPLKSYKPYAAAAEVGAALWRRLLRRAAPGGDLAQPAHCIAGTAGHRLCLRAWQALAVLSAFAATAAPEEQERCFQTLWGCLEVWAPSTHRMRCACVGSSWSPPGAPSGIVCWCSPACATRVVVLVGQLQGMMSNRIRKDRP